MDSSLKRQDGNFVSYRRQPNDRRWSKDDDRLLRELVQAEFNSRAIARELRRTLWAVRNRARVLNVDLIHAGRARKFG